MPESKVGLFRNRKSKSPHYVLFYAHTVCVHCCTCPWTAEKITSRRSPALPCIFCIFCKFCICIFCILSQLGLRCRLRWSPGPQIRLDRTRLQLLVVAVLRLPGERNVQHCVLQNLYAISQGRPSGGKRSQGRYWRWVALVFFFLRFVTRLEVEVKRDMKWKTRTRSIFAEQIFVQTVDSSVCWSGLLLCKDHSLLMSYFVFPIMCFRGLLVDIGVFKVFLINWTQ